MTDVRTQNVIDALTELGFEQRMANDSHALYGHPAGASVSIPHSQARLSSALLKAIERQVTGFGIAPAQVFIEHVFSETIHTPRRFAPETIEAGNVSADMIGAEPGPNESALGRDAGGRKAPGPSKPLRRRAAAR